MSRPIRLMGEFFIFPFNRTERGRYIPKQNISSVQGQTKVLSSLDFELIQNENKLEVESKSEISRRCAIGTVTAGMFSLPGRWNCSCMLGLNLVKAVHSVQLSVCNMSRSSSTARHHRLFSFLNDCHCFIFFFFSIKLRMHLLFLPHLSLIFP